MPSAWLNLGGAWESLGHIWYGRNARKHGGEFYLGVRGDDIASVRIPEQDRRKVAKLLRRLADRLDPKEA